MSSPCLVGWGQVTRAEGEPLDAWAAALAATGIAPGAIDSLDVVHCQSWPYDDPAGRLAARIGAAPHRLAYSDMSGTVPLRLLGAAAERIAAGEADVCAIVGGEQLAQVRRLRKDGRRPEWSHRAPEPDRGLPIDTPIHPSEIAHRLFQASTSFAIRDVARRAHLGLGVAGHRRSLGELFAPMTEVAAANPHAWFPKAWSVDELVEPTADNRMVTFPYTKRLVAIMDVDIAAAVVLASPAAASRLGIAPADRVHLRGWAQAMDPVAVAEHDELWRSPGMGRALGGALAAAGVDLGDVDHADLYSCFPSSVHFALDALAELDAGPTDHLAPYTVTGGLPYAGGAGSSYVLSSLATMADRLREDGGHGLVSGVGMHMTKHAAAVLSSEPGEVSAGPPPDPGPGPGARRPVVDAHRGAATIAGYTVRHGRDGVATGAVLVCDVDGDGDGGTGARCYAAVRDPDLLADLEAEEWVGRTVVLSDGGDGVNLATGEGPPA